MSADTTVVIAARRFDGELAYTAKVFQAIENLWFYGDARDSKLALEIFSSGPWFRGPGGLRRAKQFASILAEETRENAILEYESRPIIEIAEDRVYQLSRHGKRKHSCSNSMIDGEVLEETYQRGLVDYVHHGNGRCSFHPLPDRTGGGGRISVRFERPDRTRG